ncbi:LacI family DNA-binding transcriptional regulator [Bifidobacterium sp. CP2]|uniref:LacI family DNA-binding transcriptional regulator n=1 Tax=Bifidobacterium sp. CP2 TaxID=2809025 RepID=UPI001BDD450C|nr:LacI family DNA-binding transcriptional regulator [Bifidobacterium sp. CP2]MBT1181784.1 LacI family DNA-binding transcriptional regulator [Bifidobacterium sp. CP2]
MATAPKKATIRDVAKLAGVSYGTVSRYLNGSEHVSRDASKRIAAAIKQARYTPNNAARSLAQQRTLTVALIIQVESNETMVQSSVSEAMVGANQVLGDAGYQMVTLIANSSESTRRIAQLVNSDFADGYLLFSLSEDDSLAKTFLATARPVVRSEVSDRGDLPYPAIDFENREGQRAITRYLLDKGHSDLVYICGPGYSPSALNRLDGFKDAVGDGYDERRVYYADDWEITSGEMAAVEYQPMLDHIDGFVCANDNIAIGVINQLTRFGKRVPEDIAVTGFDDSPLAVLSNPKLTTVRQDSQLHGRAMSETLLRMLRGEDVESYYVELLPTSIVERQSA